MNSAKDTAKQVRGGLPHSETPGSPIARISPGLFAACCVLHRLSVPRHPPDALLFARSQDAARGATFRVSNPVGPPRRTTSRNPPRTGTSPSSPIQRSFTQQRVLPHHDGAASAASGPAFHEDTSSDGVAPPPPLAPQDPWPRAQIGRGRHQPPSASVTFTNSLHPVNQHRPETAPASTVPENPVFSECLFQITEIRSVV
jgi:hypothetical protein